MKRIFTAAIVMLLLQVAALAEAASIVVVPGGAGVYYVRAVDFVDISGVEVEIQYDKATLSNPRISQGTMLASTMFIPNPKFGPSAVKIAAMSISTVKGSGDLATISFDLIGTNPGPVTITRSKLVAGVAAAPVKHDTPAPDAVVTADAGSQSGANLSGGGGTSGTATTATGGGAVGLTISGSPSVGTISLPADQLAAGESGKKTEYQPLVTDLRKDMTLPLGGSESGPSSSGGQQQSGQAKTQEKTFVSYKSTLELFKGFKGEKNPKNLIALFAEFSLPGFVQEPPIAFADGKTPFKITLLIKQKGGESPKFILQGANVKKLGGEGEDVVTWTIEAVAKKDATEALLTVIEGQNVMEIPLTVVPRIDPLLAKGKTLSEADFALYLAKPQKFDLNKDSKADYVDDFIYTANYIVAMKIKPEKTAKEEKKEAAKPEAKGDGKGKEPVKAKDDKDKTAEKPAVKP